MNPDITDAGCLARHSRIVEESAHLYIKHLGAQLAKRGWRAGGEATATALIESIEAALDKRENTKPGDITFTAALMEGVDQGEADRFINDYTLGWGRDSAPVIVMGTEEAYEPTLRNLAAWNCGCSILWLSGGSLDILRCLDDDPKAYRRTDDLLPRCATVHSSDFGPTPLASQTWGCLAKVLTGSADPIDWQACFRPRVPGDRLHHGLGDLCYQIEISAYPAKTQRLGQPATPSRVQFLADLVSEARSTAKVLLFHGGAYAGTPRAQLTSAFLGTAVPELSEIDSTRGRRIWRAEHKGRVVLHTNALNGQSTSNEYLMKVTELIRKAAPEAIGHPYDPDFP